MVGDSRFLRLTLQDGDVVRALPGDVVFGGLTIIYSVAINTEAPVCHVASKFVGDTVFGSANQQTSEVLGSCADADDVIDTRFSQAVRNVGVKGEHGEVSLSILSVCTIMGYIHTYIHIGIAHYVGVKPYLSIRRRER